MYYSESFIGSLAVIHITYFGKNINDCDLSLVFSLRPAVNKLQVRLQPAFGQPLDQDVVTFLLDVLWPFPYISANEKADGC